MKYISSILVVSSLLWSSNSAFAHSGPESQCSEFLKDSSIPLDSAVENEELLGNAYPELVHTLRKEISSGRLSAEKVFFVLLPGNMGKHWEGTNHNVGYDLLLDLIQHYRAIGVDNGQQSYEVPIESVSFNANELVDEIDFPDMQNFFSQAGYARTKSGELFVARGNELQPTLVFMRRYGFYNDVGNFFVPTILEMGGNTQNIIVIHDDLKVPLGELSVEEGRATYDGNRAILSIHNNLNALSLKKKMNEARGRILEFLISPIKSQLALSAIKIDSLYRGLETLTWQVVVEAKNQMDPVQFKSLLQKKIKTHLQKFAFSAIEMVEAWVKGDLEELENLKSSISGANDKKAASQAYKDRQEELMQSNPLLADYFYFKDLLTNVNQKKSSRIDSLIQLFAEDFDPRTMKMPFSRIGIGTGFEEWKSKGTAHGFPPLPEGIGEADYAGYPHFVLSPKDPDVFGESLVEKIIGIVDQLSQNRPE